MSKSCQLYRVIPSEIIVSTTPSKELWTRASIQVRWNMCCVTISFICRMRLSIEIKLAFAEHSNFSVKEISQHWSRFLNYSQILTLLSFGSMLYFKCTSVCWCDQPTNPVWIPLLDFIDWLSVYYFIVGIIFDMWRPRWREHLAFVTIVFVFVFFKKFVKVKCNEYDCALC